MFTSINYRKQAVLLVLFQPFSFPKLLITLLVHDRHKKIHQRKYEDQQIQPHDQAHVERKIPPIRQRPGEPLRFVHIRNVHKHNNAFDNKPHGVQNNPQRIPQPRQQAILTLHQDGQIIRISTSKSFDLTQHKPRIELRTSRFL